MAHLEGRGSPTTRSLQGDEGARLVVREKGRRRPLSGGPRVAASSITEGEITKASGRLEKRVAICTASSLGHARLARWCPCEVRLAQTREASGVSVVALLDGLVVREKARCSVI